MEGQVCGCGKQGVIFLLLSVNPSRHTTAKLNEGELVGATLFLRWLDLRCSRSILTTYSNDYSCDFLRLCQNPDPVRIEYLNKGCNLGRI